MKGSSLVFQNETIANDNGEVGFLIKSTCYEIRFKPKANIAIDAIWEWKLVRAPLVDEVPTYENELASGQDIMTENGRNTVIINDIRLFDNHILWIKSSKATDFELMTIQGY